MSNDQSEKGTEHGPMSTREWNGEELGRWETPRYYGMKYVCEDCGEIRYFDGSAVKTRSPFGGDGEGCTIHTMHLENAEAYWNGEIDPDEVFSSV